MTALTLFDVPAPDPGASFVYVIGPANTSVVKIGTSIDVGKRLNELQTGHPYKLEVRWRTPGTYELEVALHRRFKRFRTYGEWFDLGATDGSEVVEIVRSAVVEITGAELPPDLTRLSDIGDRPHPADPKAANPSYWRYECGCRLLTPTEAAMLGYKTTVYAMRQWCEVHL